MKKTNLKNKKIIEKALIVGITTLFIVYFFPKKSKFKYEFEKGQIWQYENVYAPFDFTIEKTEGQILDENKPWIVKDSLITQKLIKNKTLIISKGQIIEQEKLTILNTLKNQYELKTWHNHHYLILISYGILVLCGILALLFFLKKERPEIFQKNKQVTFIFFNMLLLIFCITFAMGYENIYVYLVPLSVIPIVLKTFFDSQVALFAHIVTLLSLGFIVPNSFEFLFLQIIAGIVSILNIEQLYKRANLFLTIGKITIVYMITYVAFNVLHEGHITKLDWRYFVVFLLNGVLSLLTLFLIWFYEKIFGLVSDITLLELSNTNSPLLQQLNEKASGTFQHSIQVANLSGSAAKEIAANVLLVRTAALYHDIGKIKNAQYFIENQINISNPQDNLSALESAKIILNHVSDGVRIAQKHKLPQCIIDFIQTHHGTSFVYYFLKQQKDSGIPFNEKDFRYKGPLPFSKEMVILMLCDAVEAACKSLEKPNIEKIDDLIDRIFQNKIQARQFENAPITFRELIKIREILKRKIKDIYHIRIQYPK